MTKKKRRGGRGSLCHSLRLSLPPKKFRLRRLWQRLARERQSGDNAGRKTAGRERGPPRATPVTLHKAARDVCSLYGRVCTNVKAGRRTREIDFKQIIGYSVQGRLRDYALHPRIYVYRLYIRVYTHVCIHNANTHARIRGGIHAEWRVGGGGGEGWRKKRSRIWWTGGEVGGRKRWRKKKK